MRFVKPLTVLGLSFLLAGCWESKTDFYASVATATPLRRCLTLSVLFRQDNRRRD